MRFSQAIEALFQDHSLAIWHENWAKHPTQRFICRGQWCEDVGSHVLVHLMFDFVRLEWLGSLGFYMPMWNECDSDLWRCGPCPETKPHRSMRNCLAPFEVLNSFRAGENNRQAFMDAYNKAVLPTASEAMINSAFELHGAPAMPHHVYQGWVVDGHEACRFMWWHDDGRGYDHRSGPFETEMEALADCR